MAEDANHVFSPAHRPSSHLQRGHLPVLCSCICGQQQLHQQNPKPGPAGKVDEGRNELCSFLGPFPAWLQRVAVACMGVNLAHKDLRQIGFEAVRSHLDYVDLLHSMSNRTFLLMHRMPGPQQAAQSIDNASINLSRRCEELALLD